MSEQSIDLRSIGAILRRRAPVLAAAAVLGGVAGGLAAHARPPEYTSTSIVLLAPAPPGSSAAATAHSTDTQVEVARSDAVLGPAGATMRPRLGVEEVAASLEVTSPTTDVIRFVAKGPTAATASALADAAATADTAYLNAAANHVDAQTREALTARVATLKRALSQVNNEIAKTKERLNGTSPASAVGSPDATALSELTAQQSDLVLQVDRLRQEAADDARTTTDPSGAGTIIQRASPPVRTPPALRYALTVAVSAAAAFVLLGLLLIARARREHIVRFRDEMADAIGIPVVASLRSRAPRTAAGWAALLEGYTPSDVEMWTLRQLTRLVTPGHAGSLVERPTEHSGSSEVVVLSLSGDRRALAAGPQLASFAASNGITTTLVTAQTHESANSLWAACSGLSPDDEPRPGLTVSTRKHVRLAAELVVYVAVAERQHPELSVAGAGHAVTLLAVTAGAATAEDLARVALAADDSGHPIDRIVVVDPDPLDRTTGRALASERAAQVPLPSHLTGSTATTEATTIESARRAP